MFSVKDFYENPAGAERYRKIFTDQHRLAKDSGDLLFLMGKLTDPDPLRTIDIHTAADFEVRISL